MIDEEVESRQVSYGQVAADALTKLMVVPDRALKLASLMEDQPEYVRRAIKRVARWARANGESDMDKAPRHVREACDVLRQAIGKMRSEGRL